MFKRKSKKAFSLMELMISIGLVGMVTAGGVGLATRIAKSLANVQDIATINSKVFMLGEELEILSKQAQYIGVMSDFYDNAIRSQGEYPTGKDLFLLPSGMGDMLLFLFYDETQPGVTAAKYPGAGSILLKRMVCYYKDKKKVLRKFDTERHAPISASDQEKPFYEHIPRKNDDVTHDEIMKIDTINPLFIALNGQSFLMQTRFKHPLKSQPGAHKTFEFRFGSRTEEY